LEWVYLRERKLMMFVGGSGIVRMKSVKSGRLLSQSRTSICKKDCLCGLGSSSYKYQQFSEIEFGWA
jgi:hypothetical protein